MRQFGRVRAGKGQLRTVLEMNRLPAERLADECEVGIVVADVYALSIFRKLTHRKFTGTVQLYNHRGEFAQAYDAVSAKVEYPPVCTLIHSSNQHRFDAIIHECKIAQLLPAPDLDGFVF